jgi:hypothetical protein
VEKADCIVWFTYRKRFGIIPDYRVPLNGRRMAEKAHWRQLSENLEIGRQVWHQMQKSVAASICLQTVETQPCMEFQCVLCYQYRIRANTVKDGQSCIMGQERIQTHNPLNMPFQLVQFVILPNQLSNSASTYNLR